MCAGSTGHSVKSDGRFGDLRDVPLDRAKVSVARFIAFLIALCLFLFSELAQRPGVSLFGPAATGVIADVALWSALAWVALALGPWHRLADAVSWWPGRDPHNLYGLGALASGMLAVFGLLFGGMFLVGCIVSAVLGRELSGRLLVAAVVSLALGVFGTWMTPRAQVRAIERDTQGPE